LYGRLDTALKPVEDANLQLDGMIANLKRIEQAVGFNLKYLTSSVFLRGHQGGSSWVYKTITRHASSRAGTSNTYCSLKVVIINFYF
jgi:hypothetical protein